MDYRECSWKMSSTDSEENVNWLPSNDLYRTKSIRRNLNNKPTQRASAPKDGCCTCNAQICLAYFLSVFSSVIIVHGLWLAYRTSSRIWLVLPATGLALIMIGSCLYSSGQANLARVKGRVTLRQKYGKFNRRNAAQRQSFFESSNLSLNMLPQCFNQHNSSHRYLMLGTVSSNNDVSRSSQHTKPRVGETILSPQSQSTLTRPSTTTDVHCRRLPCHQPTTSIAMNELSQSPTPPEQPEMVPEVRENVPKNKKKPRIVVTSNQPATNSPDVPPPSYEQVLEADQNYPTL